MIGRIPTFLTDGTGELDYDPDEIGVELEPNEIPLEVQQWRAAQSSPLLAAGWNPDLHPRDHHGRFISVGDLVHFFMGADEKTGKVTGIEKGKVRVDTRDGSVSLRPDQIRESIDVRATLHDTVGTQSRVDLPEGDIPREAARLAADAENAGLQVKVSRSTMDDSLLFVTVGQAIAEWMRTATGWRFNGVDYDGEAITLGELRSRILPDEVGTKSDIRAWHLTDKPDFKLDPNVVPDDNTFAIVVRDKPGLYLGEPEPWINGHGYLRPFVVEVDAPDAEPGRWGGESFVPAESFDTTKVLRVIPTDAYAREVYGDYGWIEREIGTTFDTDEPVVEPHWNSPVSAHYPFKGYSYTGPDVREMADEEKQRHLARWVTAMKTFADGQYAPDDEVGSISAVNAADIFDFRRGMKDGLAHITRKNNATALDGAPTKEWVDPHNSDLRPCPRCMEYATQEILALEEVGSKAGVSNVPGDGKLGVEVYSEWGQAGNRSHITRSEKGTIPTSMIANMPGKMGEVPGEHRNKQGQVWEDFKADIARNGINWGIFITVDPGEEPKISEGNHRRDAAVELGMPTVPVEIRFFGKAEDEQADWDPANSVGLLDEPGTQNGVNISDESGTLDPMETDTSIDLTPIPEVTVHTIKTKYVGELRYRVEKLNKRAEKMGVEPMVLIIGEPYDIEDSDEVAGPLGTFTQHVDVTLTGTTPQLPGGWEFLGAIEHNPAGHDLNLVHGDDPRLAAYRRAEPKCDHCGLARRRANTVILADPEGNLRQVGKACVKDYLGYHSRPDAWLDWAEEVRQIADFDEERGFSTGPTYPTESALAIMAAAVRTNGFTPKSAYNNIPTATVVGRILDGRAFKANERDLQELVERVKVRDEDTAKAAEVLAWARAIRDDEPNNYLGNIRVVLDKTYLDDKDLGLASSAITAHDRATEKAATFRWKMIAGDFKVVGPEANVGDTITVHKSDGTTADVVVVSVDEPGVYTTRKPDLVGGATEHWGTVGMRAEFIAKVTSVKTFDGDYGISYLVKMETPEGHVLTTFASGEFGERAEIGDIVRAKGTVKEHGEYNGNPETKLSRVAASDIGVPFVPLDKQPKLSPGGRKAKLLAKIPEGGTYRPIKAEEKAAQALVEDGLVTYDWQGIQRVEVADEVGTSSAIAIEPEITSVDTRTTSGHLPTVRVAPYRTIDKYGVDEYEVREFYDNGPFIVAKGSKIKKNGDPAATNQEIPVPIPRNVKIALGSLPGREHLLPKDDEVGTSSAIDPVAVEPVGLPDLGRDPLPVDVRPAFAIEGPASDYMRGDDRPYKVRIRGNRNWVGVVEKGGRQGDDENGPQMWDYNSYDRKNMGSGPSRVAAVNDAYQTKVNPAAVFPDRVPASALSSDFFVKRDTTVDTPWSVVRERYLDEDRQSGLYDEIARDGVRVPVQVFVPTNKARAQAPHRPGDPEVASGHHRIAVAEELGLDVPVFWYGPGYYKHTNKQTSMPAEEYLRLERGDRPPVAPSSQWVQTPDGWRRSDEVGGKSAISLDIPETWDALSGGTDGEATEHYGEGNTPTVYVDGSPPKYVFRVMSGPEWDAATEQGFIKARNNSLTFAALKPDLRYLDGPTPGQRVVKLRYDEADGWAASWTGDQLDVATTAPIPLGRVVEVTPPGNARDIFGALNVGVKQGLTFLHSTRSTDGHPEVASVTRVANGHVYFRTPTAQRSEPEGSFPDVVGVVLDEPGTQSGMTINTPRSELTAWAAENPDKGRILDHLDEAYLAEVLDTYGQWDPLSNALPSASYDPATGDAGLVEITQSLFDADTITFTEALGIKQTLGMPDPVFAVTEINGVDNMTDHYAVTDWTGWSGSKGIRRAAVELTGKLTPAADPQINSNRDTIFEETVTTYGWPEGWDPADPKILLARREQHNAYAKLMLDTLAHGGESEMLQRNTATGDLWRGQAMTAEQVEALPPGTMVDLPLVALTDRRDKAEQFGWSRTRRETLYTLDSWTTDDPDYDGYGDEDPLMNQIERQVDPPVLLHIIGPTPVLTSPEWKWFTGAPDHTKDWEDIDGVRHGGQKMVPNGQEVVGGGRFEVVGNDGETITLRHIGTYDSRGTLVGMEDEVGTKAAVTTGTEDQYPTEVAHDVRLYELMNVEYLAWEKRDQQEGFLLSAATAARVQEGQRVEVRPLGGGPRTFTTLDELPEGTLYYQPRTAYRGQDYDEGYWIKDSTSGGRQERRRAMTADAIDVLGEDHDRVVALNEATAAVRVARAATDAHEESYAGWNRYFLVPDGHVHRWTKCSTCYPTTRFAPVAALSGQTDDEAVALLGETLCTVCFPDAPVDARGKAKKISAAQVRKIIESTRPAEAKPQKIVVLAPKKPRQRKDNFVTLTPAEWDFLQKLRTEGPYKRAHYHPTAPGHKTGEHPPVSPYGMERNNLLTIEDYQEVDPAWVYDPTVEYGIYGVDPGEKKLRDGGADKIKGTVYTAVPWDDDDPRQVGPVDPTGGDDIGSQSGLAITVPDSPEWYGRSVYSGDAAELGATVRGTPISPTDERIPDTLYVSHDDDIDMERLDDMGGDWGSTLREQYADHSGLLNEQIKFLRMVNAGRADEVGARSGITSGVTLADLIESIRAEHPEIRSLDVSENPPGFVSIGAIRVGADSRREGVGTAAMKRITEWADANGKVLALTPDPLGKGGLSKTGLVRWYRSLGFRPNTGPRRHLEVRESMVRDPQGDAVGTRSGITTSDTGHWAYGLAGPQPAMAGWITADGRELTVRFSHGKRSSRQTGRQIDTASEALPKGPTGWHKEDPEVIEYLNAVGRHTEGWADEDLPQIVFTHSKRAPAFSEYDPSGELPTTIKIGAKKMVTEDRADWDLLRDSPDDVDISEFTLRVDQNASYPDYSMAHELGHVVTVGDPKALAVAKAAYRAVTGKSAPYFKDKWPWAEYGMSEYGEYSMFETLAEAYAAWELGGRDTSALDDRPALFAIATGMGW